MSETLTQPATTPRIRVNASITFLVTPDQHQPGMTVEELVSATTRVAETPEGIGRLVSASEIVAVSSVNLTFDPDEALEANLPAEPEVRGVITTWIFFGGDRFVLPLADGRQIMVRDPDFANHLTTRLRDFMDREIVFRVTPAGSAAPFEIHDDVTAAIPPLPVLAPSAVVYGRDGQPLFRIG